MLNKMWLCTQIWGPFISANVNGFQWPELRPCNHCPLSRFLRRRKLRNSFQRFQSPHRNLRAFSRRWIYGEQRSAGIVTVISRFWMYWHKTRTTNISSCWSSQWASILSLRTGWDGSTTAIRDTFKCTFDYYIASPSENSVVCTLPRFLLVRNTWSRILLYVSGHSKVNKANKILSVLVGRWYASRSQIALW